MAAAAAAAAAAVWLILSWTALGQPAPPQPSGRCDPELVEAALAGPQATLDMAQRWCAEAAECAALYHLDPHGGAGYNNQSLFRHMLRRNAPPPVNELAEQLCATLPQPALLLRRLWLLEAQLAELRGGLICGPGEMAVLHDRGIVRCQCRPNRYCGPGGGGGGGGGGGDCGLLTLLVVSLCVMVAVLLCVQYAKLRELLRLRKRAV